MIDRRLQVDGRSHLFGAMGAALLMDADVRSGRVEPVVLRGMEDLMRSASVQKRYIHPPLELRRSSYPDFSQTRQLCLQPRGIHGAAAVEVDVFKPLRKGESCRAWLGIDIGSTSTKAVLLGAKDEAPYGQEREISDRVIAGFYTRTAGQPLQATQALFEVIDTLMREHGVALQIAGVATTGSGRKLIGAIVGADEIMDEITAHAHAAHALDPRVDTIIEIGGQDAKFTTLAQGRVTFSVMNNVCAAGTGSFIEEQANRLGCQLASCARRTQGQRAPLTSDCCTVFMERDINHYLASGYEVDEVLAAALHAVCENYLRKVARESAIGHRIHFQGATAKNRSLVAAFEQRLGKPIHVFRYCHLTGALGAALLIEEQPPKETIFRGLELWKETIPMQEQDCGLCNNHCKLKLATVGNECVAYGMLCGRDYETERYVSVNRSGFQLLKAWRKHWQVPATKRRWPITIGIPASITLHEDLPLWRNFFANLGVSTVSSEGFKDAVRIGKRLAGAEFCAPMAAYHGHVAKLAHEADYVFSPHYLEDDDRPVGTRRNFCYYSQYAATLAATIPDPLVRSKLLTPVLKNGERERTRIRRLVHTLRPVLGATLRWGEVASAYRDALKTVRERKASLPRIMQEQRDKAPNELAVVLLGRPYTVLSASMNKNIPELFGALGVRCFSQSMVEVTEAHLQSIEPLLSLIHWAYPAQTLAAAEAVASTPGLYPVIVTSFKCAPDSCAIEYVRRILDRRGKPYLVLQLDEHDSQVGYETRIEAALRTFRNHHASASESKRSPSPHRAVVQEPLYDLRDRVLLLPCWDRYACTMMAASFRREGVDARVLEEDSLLITQALQHNSGQCIPLNVMVEGFVTYVKKHGLDPSRAALWTHSSQMGCNIGAFPLVMQSLLEERGEGFEHARVYVGQMTGKDISMRAIANQVRVFVCAGNLRRMGCKIRPYELEPGQTDRLLEDSLVRLARAFETGETLLPVVEEVVSRFSAIRRRDEKRPKVAIFGDLYVRDNDVFNQGLIATLEAQGAEVVTTPYMEYTKLIAAAYLRKWVREGKVAQAVQGRLMLLAAQALERDLVRQFERVLGPEPRVSKMKMEKVLAPYRVTVQHTGESFDNLLKIHHLMHVYPDIELFVQLSPAYCCPSLITEAMAAQIRQRTGVPVVTITYDGTRVPKNGVVAPYLHFLRNGNHGTRLVGKPIRGS
jgi:predicted CoA-substrate-specific enzyme activase